MASEDTTGKIGAIMVIFFIIGMFLMFIDEGVGIIFGIGLLLFLISLIWLIIALMWSFTVSADKTWGRYSGSD